jgi:hypothetical protein
MRNSLGVIVDRLGIAVRPDTADRAGRASAERIEPPVDPFLVPRLRPLLTGFLRRARGCMVRSDDGSTLGENEGGIWQTKVRRRWCADHRRQPAKV